jgi:hypothetical protein
VIARISLVVAALLWTAPLRAQTSPTSLPDTSAVPASRDASTRAGSEFPRGKISGLTFGDLYWNAVGDPHHVYSTTGELDSGRVNIDASGRPITRDLNGLQFRRIYFQLDNDLSERFATRLRLEMDGRSLTSDGKITAFLKNAYLQAKHVELRGDLLIGMVNTPTWDTAEALWQYRSVEKTLGDFLGLASSSDLGVRANGFLDPGHRVGYMAMVGDGTGQRPENNRDKRFYLAIPLRFANLTLEPYVDYEMAPASGDRATYRAFAGVDAGRTAVGVEYYDRVAHAPGGNRELRAASVFARWSASDAWGVFARADVWDPNVRVPDRVREWLWIAGLDWRPFPDVHVMPNIEATHHAARGAATAPPWHDLQARLTFYYTFTKPQS